MLETSSTSDYPAGPRRLAGFFTPGRIALIYLLAGVLWILFSDRALELWLEPGQAVARVQTIKGMSYVGATALLLWWMIRARHDALLDLARSLAESERKYRKLIDESGDAILVLEPDGIIRIANPKSQHLFGIGTTDIGQNNFFDRLPPEAGLSPQADLPLCREATIKRSDGDIAHIEIQMTRMYDGNLLVEGRDHTTQHRMAARLQVAEKMELVGELASEVAHDFNNLLNVILASAGAAKDAIAKDRSPDEDLDSLTDAARRGADLTRQLLAFSRRQPLEPRPLYPHQAIGRIVPIARRLLAGGIAVHLDTPDPQPVIFVDPTLLEQSLLNLITNARDAMPDGGGITISARRGACFDDGNPCAEITVADDGIGMDEDTLARIFEPFFTTKPEGIGTGLGMSMVQQFVTRSGGEVVVDSTPGHGTRITLKLPLAPATVG